MSAPVVIVETSPGVPVVLPGALPDTTVALTPAPAAAATVVVPGGVPGAQGVPGLPGPAPVVLVFTLSSASSWFQEHAFAYPPAVRLVDGVGEQVCLGVAYPDATHVNLVFPTPFTGKVILS